MKEVEKIVYFRIVYIPRVYNGSELKQSTRDRAE